MTPRHFSVYVHVPFCARKCPYCDFNTYAVARVPEDAYVDAVCRELELYAKSRGFVGRPVGTVFFGGGTPSLFSAQGIGEILRSIDRLFPVVPGREVTLEANPNHSDPDYLRGLAAAGVNRISFGAQSFRDQQLVMLGRDHSAADIARAVKHSIEAGISNVSLDIIFGVPGQTMSQLQNDLRDAVALPIAHISTYALTIEPGTPFFQRQERGLLRLPKDERVVEMLNIIPEILSLAGFRHYEISNFARPGCESEHNKVYWRGGDYLGVGAGAHSFLGCYSEGGAIESGDRWSNLALPQSYIDGVSIGESTSWRESLDQKGLIFEFFYLGLRLIGGVSQRDFKERFGSEISAEYTDKLKRLASEGFVEVEGNRIRLTKSGIALADSVFEQLG